MGVNVSSSTVRRVRRNLGWRREKARYCQLIRESNKIKRLSFCLKALKDEGGFEDVKFTDETSVEIQHYTRHCFKMLNDTTK